MRVWAIFWAIVAVFFGLFVVANWQVLTLQTSINLLVSQVTAPLGLVMLGVMGVLTLLYLLFLVWLETRVLVQLRSTVLAKRMDRVEQVVRDEVGRIDHRLSARLEEPPPPARFDEPHMKHVG
jgi:hypothetical protein